MRGKVAKAVWIGFKRNFRVDIGRTDNWETGRWDRERKNAVEEKETDRVLMRTEESHRYSDYRKRNEGLMTQKQSKGEQKRMR